MSYKFDTIVNRTEAEALKEMIFSRVRERSQGMAEDIQTDVMDLARGSFVSNNNPFSNIAKVGNDEFQKNSGVQSQVEAVAKKSLVSDKEVFDNHGVGFPVREPKLRQNRVINEQIVSATVVNTMSEARKELSKKSGFIGALNFLNTQASISLSRTRADKFEVVA